MAAQSSQSATCYGYGCKRTNLVEAHIVPKGFSRFMRGNAHNMRISLNSAAKARQQLGAYDAGILCGSCDNLLGSFDNYALQICKAFKSGHKVISGDVFELANVDGDKFAKFVLAVLWRGSISSLPDYADVSLGQYEKMARDVLFGVQPLSCFKEFEVLMQRYTSKHFDTERFYSTPVRAPFGDLDAYGFSLAGFRVTAKLDPRPLPAAWGSFTINSNNALRGFFVEIEGTQEFRRIASMMVAENLRQSRTK
jgi:hypothetical protein